MQNYILDPNGLLALARSYVLRGGALVAVGVAPPVAPPDTVPPATLPVWDSAPVAAVSVQAASRSGAVAADSLAPGVLLNRAGYMQPSGYGGNSNSTFAIDVNGRMAARTVASARDAVVEGFAFAGSCYLRLGDDGTAWQMGIYGLGNDLEMEVLLVKMTEAPDGTLTRDVLQYLGALNGEGRPAARSKTITAGQRFRFSAIGFDVKAEHSADGGATWTAWFDAPVGHLHMASGKAAWSANGAISQGWESYEARLFSPKPLWSDASRVGDGGFASRVYSALDFGMRDTSPGGAQTTGSMAAGSNILTLEQSIGLNVGNGVIVRRGANASVSGPGGMQVGASSGRWYEKQDRGFSLRAKVTALSNDGRTVTLDTPCVSASTGAKVYYDNARAPMFTEQRAFGLTQQASPTTMRVPAGTFHMGTSVLAGSQTSNIVFEGAGKHFTVFRGVEGCNSTGINFSACENGIARHFAVVNDFTSERFATFEFVKAVSFGISNNTTISDILYKDCSGGISADYSYGAKQLRCVSENTDRMAYVQWLAGGADSNNVYVGDCKITSVHFVEGFEPFRMQGTHFVRCSTVNASSSNNSCRDTHYERFHQYFDEGCVDRSIVAGYNAPRLSPTLNYNFNAQGAEVSGGKTTRHVLAFGGPVVTGPGAQVLNGLTASGPQKNVIVTDNVVWYSDSAKAVAPSHAALLEGIEPSGHLVERGWTNAPPKTDGYPYANYICTEVTQGTIRDTVAGVVTATNKSGNRTWQQWRDALTDTSPPTAAFRIEADRGPGALNFWTHAEDVVLGDGVDLCTSPFGEITRFEWEHLRGGAVVGTDRARWASFVCQPGDGVRLTVWDQLGQSSVTTQTVTG